MARKILLVCVLAVCFYAVAAQNDRRTFRPRPTRPVKSTTPPTTTQSPEESRSNSVAERKASSRTQSESRQTQANTRSATVVRGRNVPAPIKVVPLPASVGKGAASSSTVTLPDGSQVNFEQDVIIIDGFRYGKRRLSHFCCNRTIFVCIIQSV